MAVEIQLEDDEALVLFEFLSSQENLRGALKLEAPETLALECLHAALERVLVVPFDPNYSTHVATARTSLLKRSGEA